MNLPINTKTLNHIAIIMDGNGRWANLRSHSRIFGHVRGASNISDIVEASIDLNIKSLTLYAFSTENWSRPLDEIKVLFSLLQKFLKREEKKIIKQQIKFKVIGDLDKLPDDTQKMIRRLEELTKNFNKINLTFAFSYGGRGEIVNAVNTHIKNNPGLPVTQEDIANNLMNPEIGDVDLLIRTGGEKRISNFLLWQMAYSEMYFTKSHWPDFSKEEFNQIINDVSKRERRFGTVKRCASLFESDLKSKKNIEMLHEAIR